MAAGYPSTLLAHEPFSEISEHNPNTVLITGRADVTLTASYTTGSDTLTAATNMFTLWPDEGILLNTNTSEIMAYKKQDNTNLDVLSGGRALDSTTEQASSGSSDVIRFLESRFCGVHAQRLFDEVAAVQTELGTDVAGTETDLKTRLAVSINDDGTLKASLSPTFETITVSNAATINNDQDATGDFLVKGQSISHAFFVDVSTGRSHVAFAGTPTGTFDFNVNGTIHASGTKYTFGDDVTPTWSGTTADHRMIIGSNTDTEEVAYELYVNEAVHNPRAKFFVDDANNNWGFEASWSGGNLDFVIREGATEILNHSSANNIWTFKEDVEITPTGTNYDTFIVNFSDGTPRITAGTFETATAYGVFHFGNITPSNTNYTLAGIGSDTLLNSTSAIRMMQNNGELMRVGGGEVVINETAINADFRIEGTSLTHGFFYDASTGRVHIGFNSTPTGSREVNIAGRVNFSPSANYEEVIRWNDSGGALRGALGVLSSSSNYGGLWLGGYSPSSFNYALLGNASTLETILNAPTSGSLLFRINNADKGNVDSNGNLLWGTTTSPTGTNGKVLMFGDNTGDPTPGSNTCGIYGKDVSTTVEVFAIDEAANATQLSPHDTEGYWWYYSQNQKTGRELKVHLEKFFNWFIKKNPEAKQFLEETFPLDVKDYKKKTKRKEKKKWQR